MKQKKQPKPFQLKLNEIPTEYLHNKIPKFMWQLGRIIIDHPIEGIFRKDSGIDGIIELKKRINKNEEIKFEEHENSLLNFGKIITSFFYELPHKIFSIQHRFRFSQIMTRFQSLRDLEKTVVALCLALRLFNSMERKLILFSLNLYFAVSKNHEINRMTIRLFLFYF